MRSVSMLRWLRHQYDIIDNRIVWDAIHHRIPPLKISVTRALLELEAADQ